MLRASPTTTIPLRYGCNPHQAPAELIAPSRPSPLQVLNGELSYINVLDALTAWQLVTELKTTLSLPAAASYKHVSPAGAAVTGPISDEFHEAQMLPPDDLSPVANAYVRARGGDRMCSFGDAAAVSDTVDMSLARVLKREVSSLLIAPDYEADALEVLKVKQNGRYVILKMDPSYQPPQMEERTIFGFGLSQPHNDLKVTEELFRSKGGDALPASVLQDLVVGTIALKHTQSNSVCVTYQGQVIGMGAGQQSRVHCTRIACDKADKWFLQQHPRVRTLPFRSDLSRVAKTNAVDLFLLWDRLSPEERGALRSSLTVEPTPLTGDERREWLAQFAGASLCSDAYLGFRDNIDRANASGVRCIAETGGSAHDDEVATVAKEHGITLIRTGVRCFLH